MDHGKDNSVLDAFGQFVKDFYLNYVNQSLSLRLIECALHYVLLEHGELPCVLSFDVHLDLGHLPDTQGYFRLLPEP